MIKDVTDDRERDLQVKLIRQYGISISEVLWAQWCLTNGARYNQPEFKANKLKPVSITEYVESGRTRNVKIRRQFIGDDVSEEEEHAIYSLEWYRYNGKEDWGRTCNAAALLYRILLLRGRLAAAKGLAIRASLSELSTASVNMDLSQEDAVDEFSDDRDGEVDRLTEEDRAQPTSPSRRRPDWGKEKVHPFERQGFSRDVLAAKARTWLQLEQLITVMDTFEAWNHTAEEVERYGPFSSGASHVWSADLQ